MADNKKYYYLKIKENFYDSEEMIILQSMKDGYLYSDILLKLYLRSLKNNGKLMFNDVIPYTPDVLATVVRHQVGTVEKALKTFRDLGLIEILDNGAIYLLDIQNFIGESSTEADRKREYRARIEQEKESKKMIEGQKGGQMSNKCPDKTPPEIEIEKDIDIEKEIEIDENISVITDKQSKVNYQEFVDTYNMYCIDLPKVQKLSDTRKRSIKTFLKNFNKEEFKTICLEAQKSDFLSGRNGRFQASFDWVLKIDNATKVLEGNYKNKTMQTKNNIQKQNNLQNRMDLLKQMYEEEELKNEQARNY